MLRSCIRNHNLGASDVTDLLTSKLPVTTVRPTRAVLFGTDEVN